MGNQLITAREAAKITQRPQKATSVVRNEATPMAAPIPTSYISESLCAVASLVATYPVLADGIFQRCESGADKMQHHESNDAHAEADHDYPEADLTDPKMLDCRNHDSISYTAPHEHDASPWFTDGTTYEAFLNARCSANSGGGVDWLVGSGPPRRLRRRSSPDVSCSDQCFG